MPDYGSLLKWDKWEMYGGSQWDYSTRKWRCTCHFCGKQQKTESIWQGPDEFPSGRISGNEMPEDGCPVPGLLETLRRFGEQENKTLDNVE